MPRLRYTPEQARAEAERLAVQYVAGLDGASGYVFRDAVPDRRAPKSASTKLPVVWHALFMPDLPEFVVADGAELIVAVNIETKAVWRLPF